MFFFGSGLSEIECDAPAYSVVQACRKLGLQSPEDVRWCQARERLEASAAARLVEFQAPEVVVPQ